MLAVAGRTVAEPDAGGAAPRVDLSRMAISPTGVTAPTTSGAQARLTVDPSLQRTAETLLARADPVSGAVVAADARTGRILIWADRRRGGGRPGTVLSERQAPAASLFKIITTAALLERGHVHPQKRVCWSGGEHGIWRRHLAAPQRGKIQCGPFGQALGYSRNAVFAQLATSNLMHADLVDTIEQFGFNAPVPFDATVKLGVASVPVDDLGFARTAAGFENSTLSPLGALSLAYDVAAGGQAIRLHIVEQAGSYSAPAKRQLVRRVMSQHTAANLRWMMEVTVHSGTSLEAFSDDSGQSYLGKVRVAGKTGTLQESSQGPTTTWFIGFAPSRDPRVVVSVLLENGAVWRRKANQVARDVLRAYFAQQGVHGVSHPLD
jgi:peptidoglycan glycosyltransferase